MATPTKELIAESLKRFMQKMPFDKITIKDIVADAGISRQTFYYHFQDIFDVLDWIYRTEAIENINCYTYETWKIEFERIFRYCLKNKKFVMNCFYSLGREPLERFLYGNTFALLYHVVGQITEGTDATQKEKTFISDFYTYAFIGIIKKWVSEGMVEDPKEIIKNIDRLIEGDIKKAVPL